MTGALIAFTRSPARHWRIVELSPGRWRGELHVAGKDVTTMTAEGHYLDVRDAVDDHRCGLALRIERLGPDTGPQAA